MQGQPNFLEKQVELALQAMLTCRFQGTVFYTVPNESLTGADLEIQSAWPVFIQVKRSMWALVESTFASSPKILRDRITLGLPTPFVYYVKLHARKPAQPFSQNEVMFLTNEAFRSVDGLDCVRYVTPLQINVADYLVGVGNACQALLNSQPATPLDGHTCFPPHFFVDGTGHKYSFEIDGSDRCFHDAELISEHPTGFLPWIAQHEEAIRGGRELLSRREIERNFSQLFSQIKAPPVMQRAVDLGYDPVRAAISFLRTEYQITTYLFGRQRIA